MTFGEKIKKIRLDRNMTLEQVGEIVGVSKSTVHKWETNDIRNMGRSKIIKLAYALSVEPGYLMGWDDEPEENRYTKEDYALIRMFKNADLSAQKIVLEILMNHQR